MMVNCPSCGSENAAHRRYCRKCGRSMGSACPTCQFFNLTEDAFCGGCGVRLILAEAQAAAGRIPLSDDMGIAEEDFQDLLNEHSSSPTITPPSPPANGLFGENSSS